MNIIDVKKNFDEVFRLESAKVVAFKLIDSLFCSEAIVVELDVQFYDDRTFSIVDAVEKRYTDFIKEHYLKDWGSPFFTRTIENADELMKFDSISTVVHQLHNESSLDYA